MKVLIDPAEVNTLQKSGQHVVFIDARGGPDAHSRYRNGHLEGAFYVDLESELSTKAADAADGGRHPLPDPEKFGDLLGELGISPPTIVVVYDDKNGANAAARFWWMMRACGHEQVYIVNGGWKALARAGMPVSIVETARPAKAASYPVSNWVMPLATMNEVERTAGRPGHLVIDVREAYRYRGEGEPFDLIAGHIPGAVNIPYVDNMDADGEFLSAAALAQIYKPAVDGVKPGNIIVHCGSGVTACHTLVAMEEAGLSGAKLYVGSWSEWSCNGKPVATGEQ